MAFDFSGKKILVTGAGRGIGRSFALEIAAAGATVYALGRTKEMLDSLVEESDRIHPIVADISDWDKTRPLLDKLEVMDGVVNNAAETPAYKGIQAALEFPKEELELFQRVNVLGTINVIQSTGKKMVAAGNGGSIVNISSMAAINPVKNTLAYNVSKAGLDMVTKQFALELGPNQIRVNSVNLCMVLAGAFEREWQYSEQAQRAKAITPMGKFCSLKEVCGPVMYLLSDHSTMVNGTNQSWMVGCWHISQSKKTLESHNTAGKIL